MKAFKILLSVVLSLAMLLGMACAGAETLVDGGLILRNVCINLNGTEITLPYEARLNAVVEDTGAKLQFEVGRGAGVLLPLRGEIHENGVRFGLGHSGRVYSLDMNMLAEIAGVDLDDVSPEQMGMATQIVEDYIALVEAVILPENVEKLEALEDEMLCALTGSEGEDAEIEYGGESYPGKRYAGGLSMEGALSIVNLVSSTGIEAVDSYFANLLEIFNQSMDMELQSMDQLFAFMIEDAGMTEEDLAMEIMEIELEIGGNDDLQIERVTMIPADTGMEITVAEIVSPDKVEMSVDFGMGDLIYGTDANALFTADLTEGAVTAFALEINADEHMDMTSDDYTNTDQTEVAVIANGKVEGGLWSADLDVNFYNESVYGSADEEETYTEKISFSGTYAETLEEDGSVTSAIALGMDFGEDDEKYGLSFDLNVAAGTGPKDLFGEGSREYALADEDGIAYELLEMDAGSLYADAMEFTVDESVITLLGALEEMFMADLDGYDFEEYEDYEDYGYEDYEDYGYEDSDYESYETYEEPYEAEVPEMSTVYSMEEAAEIFAGEIPAFTAPEGYDLSYVDVDSMSFYADYANAEDMHIGLMVIDFGMDMGGDGSDISYYEDDAGLVFAAELYSGSNYVLVQFDSTTAEAAEEILAGLAY